MGIGTRNESTQEYIYSKAADQGHWYRDDDDNLYIIPNDAFEDEESYGPDNANMDALNAAYRGKRFDFIDPDELAEELGLEYIVNALHRFDVESGFYSA